MKVIFWQPKLKMMYKLKTCKWDTNSSALATLWCKQCGNNGYIQVCQSHPLECILPAKDVRIRQDVNIVYLIISRVNIELTWQMLHFTSLSRQMTVDASFKEAKLIALTHFWMISSESPVFTLPILSSKARSSCSSFTINHEFSEMITPRSKSKIRKRLSIPHMTCYPHQGACRYNDHEDQVLLI